jgi:hypothetical protein
MRFAGQLLSKAIIFGYCLQRSLVRNKLFETTRMESHDARLKIEGIHQVS